MAQALLKKGSGLFSKGHCDATALHLAARHNHCEMLRWLLAEGMVIGVTNEFGNTALHEAVDHDCFEAAALLLQNGADVNEQDHNGFRLIHGIDFTGDFSMLKFLVQNGANIHDVSGGGSWPLKEACSAANAEAVAYLLGLGADANLTSSGATALFDAVGYDSMACVSLLVDAGADMNAQDCDGWTCLYHLRSEPMAIYLLEKGANPSISDQCGGLPENWGSIPRTVRQLLKASRESVTARQI
jgi:ankyrin repeat protein